MKKAISMALLAFLAVSLIFAGGGKQSAGGGKTLSIATSANWTKDIDRTLADKFTAETGIKVEFQAIPDDQYFNVLKARLSMGETADIFMTNAGTSLEDFQPEKNFLELSGEPWVARTSDWAIPGISYNGKIVAFNLWSPDTWSVLYDPAKFQKAGITSIPKTYADFRAACDKLVAAGYIPFYGSGSAVWFQTIWFSAILGVAKQQDPDYQNKFNNNTLKFADVSAYELALTQLKELHDSGYFGPTFMADTWENSITEMAKGKYAMIIVYSTYQNEVAAATPNSGAEKWEMFPFPLVDNTEYGISTGGVVHVINKNSQNIDAAKAYLNFRSRVDNVEAFYKARQDLGASAFKDYPGATTKAWETVNKNSTGTFGLDPWIKYIDGNGIGLSMQELFMGTKTPKQVLQGIDDYRQKQFDMLQ
jgi:raffinose/stachyose/melibiose transport system substrate-binding protein